MNTNIPRFLVMDVDGTLTDGKIYMSDKGELFKAFDIKDGCGIKDILPNYNCVPIVITARKSKLLDLRCKELGISEVYQGERNKITRLESILNMYSSQDGISYTLHDVAYIGDDILDLQCMEPIKESGGLIGCPADAVTTVKNISDYISEKRGGQGAVRDFIEWFVNREKDQ